MILYTLLWGSYKAFMYNCYSAFSKYKNHYIMSDKKQTQFSKKNWKNWYNTKQNISEIFAYNYDTKQVIYFTDIEDSWCKSEECRKFRLVVKFK